MLSHNASFYFIFWSKNGPKREIQLIKETEKVSNRYPLVIVCGVNLFKEKKNWGKALVRERAVGPWADPAE